MEMQGSGVHADEKGGCQHTPRWAVTFPHPEQRPLPDVWVTIALRVETSRVDQRQPVMCMALSSHTGATMAAIPSLHPRLWPHRRCPSSGSPHGALSQPGFSMPQTHSPWHVTPISVSPHPTQPDHKGSLTTRSTQHPAVTQSSGRSSSSCTYCH